MTVNPIQTTIVCIPYAQFSYDISDPKVNRWFKAGHFGIRPMKGFTAWGVFFPNSTPPTHTGLRFFFFFEKYCFIGKRIITAGGLPKKVSTTQNHQLYNCVRRCKKTKKSHRQKNCKKTSLLKSNEFWRFLTQLRFQDEAKLSAYSSKNGPQ